MKNKPTILLLSAVLILAFALVMLISSLVGCGGDDGGESEVNAVDKTEALPDTDESAPDNTDTASADTKEDVTDISVSDVTDTESATPETAKETDGKETLSDETQEVFTGEIGFDDLPGDETDKETAKETVKETQAHQTEKTPVDTYPETDAPAPEISGNGGSETSKETEETGTGGEDGWSKDIR